MNDDPSVTTGEAAAGLVADLRFRRHVEELYCKGPRVLAEFLGEIAATHSLRTPIERLLEQYLAIDDAALELTAGDRFAPVPLHEVGNDRG